MKYSELACCRSHSALAVPLSRTGAKPLLHRVYARFHTLLLFTIKGKQLSKQNIALDKHKLQDHHQSPHSLIHCLSSKRSQIALTAPVLHSFYLFSTLVAVRQLKESYCPSFVCCRRNLLAQFQLIHRIHERINPL